MTTTSEIINVKHLPLANHQQMTLDGMAITAARRSLDQGATT